MSCCCINKYPFCTMPACNDEGINLSPITAAMDGEYTLELKFLGGRLITSKTFATDETIIFPSHDLNENFEYEGVLRDPNGEKVLFNIGENETLFDCFSFSVKPTCNLQS